MPFREFIKSIEMEKIHSKGRLQMWANNRDEEGFVEEKLDRFFYFCRMDTRVPKCSGTICGKPKLISPFIDFGLQAECDQV